MSESQFCFGFLIGGLIVAAFGYTLQQIFLNRAKAGQASKKVMLVKTVHSPEEVTKASRRARWAFLGWTIIFIVLGVGAVVLLLNLI